MRFSSEAQKRRAHSRYGMEALRLLGRCHLGCLGQQDRVRLTRAGTELSKIAPAVSAARDDPNMSADQKTAARTTYNQQRDKLLDQNKGLPRQA
jgi:hypothetical protein